MADGGVLIFGLLALWYLGQGGQRKPSTAYVMPSYDPAQYEWNTQALENYLQALGGSRTSTTPDGQYTYVKTGQVIPIPSDYDLAESRRTGPSYRIGVTKSQREGRARRTATTQRISRVTKKAQQDAGYINGAPIIPADYDIEERREQIN